MSRDHSYFKDKGPEVCVATLLYMLLAVVIMALVDKDDAKVVGLSALGVYAAIMGSYTAYRCGRRHDTGALVSSAATFDPEKQSLLPKGDEADQAEQGALSARARG